MAVEFRCLLSFGNETEDVEYIRQLLHWCREHWGRGDQPWVTWKAPPAMEPDSWLWEMRSLPTYGKPPRTFSFVVLDIEKVSKEDLVEFKLRWL